MTITFQLKSKAAPVSKPAAVTYEQICGFRAFAQTCGHLVGVMDDPDFSYFDEGFDARVCPWSWASLARIFGNEEPVICVIEEAQFLRSNVRFWRIKNTGEIMIGVSSNPDGSFPLYLDEQNAQLLLDAIGVGCKTSGAIDMTELADVINDPSTRRHLSSNGLESYVDQLDRMARACLSPESQLIWE
jgi:hypothetical protein